ncbi:MAG: septum formation inhibitor Maf [Methylotenera sp.]|nr:septum formation inhibitor Maf [Methylotenera sp.]MSP99201.1 septum formation inhibitor Maf [Methylotenera sp.]
MSKKIDRTGIIYLASRSPRRVELLKQIGVSCETLPADIDETPYINEPAESYVRRLARQKAEACLFSLNLAQRLHPVLAADTTVVLAGLVLGKPEHDDDARRMLSALSGSQHQVHTAVALAFNGDIEVVLSTTIVEMMALSEAQINAYIATGEHHDKAGSYGIQGAAGAWIKRIEGSYSGVMGLPLYETANLLSAHGISL